MPPAYVASRRPRSKMAGRGVRKGSMRQQLKPKTAKQLEAEERRLKRFDSDSESETEALPPKAEELAPEQPADDLGSAEEEQTLELEDSEVEDETPEAVEDEEMEDSGAENEDATEEEVTEEEDSADEEESPELLEKEDEEGSEEDTRAKDKIKGDKIGQKSENNENISGWADSIAKILGSSKPKNKKEIMLSRARKDYEVSQFAKTGAKPPRHPQGDLEVIPGVKQKLEDTSVEEDEKKPNVDGVLSLKVQRKLELKQKKLERAWENLARMNMEKSEPEVERDLLKIATKGVVQLFNAIAMQQKTIKSKLKNTRQSEFQKEKILNQTKDIFDSSLSKSKLMGDGSTLNQVDLKVKQEQGDQDFEKTSRKKRKSNESGTRDSKKKPAWNALQDDFMLDAKLKDWDQNSDSE